MLIGDLVAAVIFIGLAVLFALPGTRSLYDTAYAASPIAVSFVKFAILATGGEWIARRIKDRSYSLKGFGLLPKALCGEFWGFSSIGLSRYLDAVFQQLFHFSDNPSTFGMRLLGAFLTSLSMNLIFSPVLMLTHHLTDKFIGSNGGRFPLNKLKIQPLLESIDWNRMWGFVFKITIPLFWIPAHTFTFLLPTQYRTLFAALLSVVLGILLGIAGKKK